MIGFRGLIPKPVISYEAIEFVTKKGDDLRKNCQLIIDFLNEVSRFNETKANTNLKILSENGNYEYRYRFNKSLFSTLQKIIENQKQLGQSSRTTCNQSSTHLTSAFNEVIKQLSILQQAIKSYQESELHIYEQSKKYYKTHKSLLTAVDLYKASFSDVNLIYNMDEKNRRYEQCQSLFNTAEKLYQDIGCMCGQLFQKKRSVVDIYRKVIDCQERCLKDVSKHSIGKVKQMLIYMSVSIIQTIQAMKKFQQSQTKLQTSSIFAQIHNQQKLQNFTNLQQIDQTTLLPLSIQYPHLLKQENLNYANIQISNYIKLVEQRLKVMKNQNKKIYEAIRMYFGNIQKIMDVLVKEVLVGFQKNRKKLADCFGNRFVTFLKSLTSLFQLSVGTNQKMMGSTSSLRQSIQLCITEQSKLLKYFSEQTKSSLQKFSKKKQQSQQSASMRILLRKQNNQKADIFKHLITGFQQKIQTNYIKLMNNYNQLITFARCSMEELHSFCQEYIEVYFGSEAMGQNMSKFREDFENTRKKVLESYDELAMHALVKDQSQIVFEGEFSKIAVCKKLKKPAKIQNLQQQGFEFDETASQDPKAVSTYPRLKSQTQAPQNLTQIERQVKNAQFLKNKIAFKQNQLLIKTYSCALAQKIILQGKLFLTTQRICFHSNFNSSNIFFGKTFIQFPKSDIRKIQKRRLTLLFDNSISFTTINGQIIFTSIFSRDETYNMICKTFNFNLDNQVYQYEEKEAEELPQFLVELEENDDIKVGDLEARKVNIDRELGQFAFVEANSMEFVEEGLNALKMFKIFYSDNQIVMGNRKYASFLAYYKQLLNHTQLTVQEWTPSLSLILNQSNIKQSSPLFTKRKLFSTVPVSASGVPFMPKTAKSSEIQTLSFYSKHKFVLQSTIQTMGVPYSDTFKIQLRTTVDSNQEGNKCKVVMEYFINFVKSTMMKSVIQSKSKDETVGASKIWLNSMKKYFQYQNQKAKQANIKKKNKNTNSNEQQLQNSLNQANTQIDQLKQQNKLLQIKLSDKQKKQSKYKIGIIVIVVLWVVSVVVLLCGQ